MKIIIRKHAGYLEFERAMAEAKKRKIKLPLKQYFGEHQFIFKEDKREFSIVQLWDIFGNRWFWESAELTKEGVRDVERFATFEQAQDHVLEILRGVE